MVVVVAWWVAGAAVFSRVEGAAEHETVSKMAELRTDLVLGLATELRQVGSVSCLFCLTITSLSYLTLPFPAFPDCRISPLYLTFL